MRYMRVYDGGHFNGDKEEGIYKVKQYLGMSNCYDCYDSNNERHLFDYRAGKIADTIEELCDEFVYLMKSRKHICKNKHTDILYCFDEDKPLAYYGAIWTDKGLIYVAKMNEKGELELL
ncbi:MAG: hypothetical protein K5765_06650 [Clostridia bacterium]|nr:hypothetical protein [Clostridia bacterium]